MANKIVLVVDDEPHIREILTHFLEREGYHVHATGEPEDALAFARRTPPDAVFLDIMMPRIDGIDLCQMMHEHNRTRRIPVVFVSAMGDERTLLLERVAGGALHIQKPFSRQSVLCALRISLQTPHERKAGESAPSPLPPDRPSFRVPEWEETGRRDAS